MVLWKTLKTAVLVLTVSTAVLLSHPVMVLGENGPTTIKNGKGSLDDDEDVHELGSVVVKGDSETNNSGKTTIKGKHVGNIPTKNSTINDKTGVMPNVQLSESYNSAQSGGEIAPPEISISGGRPYENKYLIEGTSINNRLDPVQDNPNDLDSVASHSQTQFIPPSIIGDLNLYDCNIPARYGGFSGGVIDAKIKKPGKKFTGMVNVRTTNHHMTHTHVHKGGEYAFNNSNSHDQQPEFYKYEFASYAEVPLSKKSSILLSYDNKYSIIPLILVEKTKNQWRSSQNFLAKYVYDISKNNILDIQLSYTPYEAGYFIKNAKNSDFTITNGGFMLNTSYTRIFKSSEMNIQASYQRTENERNAPTSWYLWRRSKTKDWGSYYEEVDPDEENYDEKNVEYSTEGGFGTLRTIQENKALKWDFIVEEFGPDIFKQKIETGFLFEHIWGSYDRPVTTYIHKDAVIHDQVTGESDAHDYVPYEQYFSKRIVYEACYVEADINELSYYIQDSITVYRLNIVPGLRLSYDDYMKNLNIAPRIMTILDIFGSGNSKIISGYNRYYDMQLLAYKLREGRKPNYTEYRTVYQNDLEPWLLSSEAAITRTNYSELNTPYVDEYNIGFAQKIKKSTLTFVYLKKYFDDQFARSYSEIQPDGYRYYTLNNNGESTYTSYSLKWNFIFKNHFLMINATYEETISSNENYDETLESDDTTAYIWYNGKIIKQTMLPRKDYNRPFICNATYSGKFGPFLVSLLGKYRSGYVDIVKTNRKKAIPGGEKYTDPLTGELITESLNVYESHHKEWTITIDLKFKWSIKLHESHTLSFYTDITNVLNTKAELAGSSYTYEMGRQIWTGCEYSF